MSEHLDMTDLTPQERDDILTQMRGSDNVKLRDIGVIATWLVEQPWVLSGPSFDPVAAAKELIRAQTAAGLATFIQADLDTFIVAEPVSDDTRFEGRNPRSCGDHRTTTGDRAWCSDCTEWCYPDDPCVGCRCPQGVHTALDELDRLRR